MRNIKTNRAICFFWNEEKSSLRHIIFGDPEELLPFLIAQAQIVMEEIRQLSGKDFKDVTSLQQALNEIEKFGPDNYPRQALEDSYFEFNYKIHEKD